MAINQELLQKHVTPDAIMVEAGAHIGRDTIKMHKRWPHATIHAFEPVPALYAELHAKTAGIPSIHTYPSALGTHTGTTTLHISSSACTAVSSLLEPTGYRQERPDVTFETRPVAVITLDDWAARHSIEKIDFLWLDLQGYEQAMLAASPRMLAATSVIHTEITCVERYAGQPLYPEYRAWLEHAGFTLIEEDLYRITWGNALFVRNGVF